MGRGLSELQKTILRMAYRNHMHEGRDRPTSWYKVLCPVNGGTWDDHPDDPLFRERVRRVYPNAFTTHMTGSWLLSHYRGRGNWNLVVRSTRDRDEAQAVVELLSSHGFDAVLQRPEDSVPDELDLYDYEILWHAFGFSNATRRNVGYRSAWDGRRTPSWKHFDRSKIEPSKYAAAAASTSRACSRLAQRGLVVRVGGAHHAGVCLTEAGYSAAWHCWHEVWRNRLASRARGRASAAVIAYWVEQAFRVPSDQQYGMAPWKEKPIITTRERVVARLTQRERDLALMAYVLKR